MINPKEQSDQQGQILAYAHAHGYSDTSARYSPCRVGVWLTQPIGGYDHTHIDGLLSSAVVRDALRGVPLLPRPEPYAIPLPMEVLWRSQTGLPLYHCSSLLPSGEFRQSVFTWTKKNDPSVSYFTERKRDGSERQPDNGSGPDKEYCVGLQIKSIPHLMGVAVGDIEEIKRLLAMVWGVGKKIALGLGTIAHIEAVPCEIQGYCFVEYSALKRPVPAEACKDLGLSLVGDVQLAGYTPPYWLPANQADCYMEKSSVSNVSVPYVPLERVSVPDFLYRCYVQDGFRHISRGGAILQHPKCQRVHGMGQPCVITGLPITDSAVPARYALSSDMGNVVDFCQAPESLWVSNAAAVILSLPKIMHRNLVALIRHDPVRPLHSGHLLWPSVAIDKDHPTQPRPLWREVLIALVEQYMGYRCVLIFKDEPKSRTWPRARIGTIGEQTPLLFKDSSFGIEAVLQISIPEALRQMLYIESLLDTGYGKMEIRDGLKSPSIERLIETLAIEKKLAAMRTTPEFPFAWYIARNKEDRVIREGIHIELD